MDEHESKFWRTLCICVAGVIGLIVVSIAAYYATVYSKAFSQGYEEVQGYGTAVTLWQKVSP